MKAVYERKFTLKLILLRTLGLVLFVSSIYLPFTKYSDYSVLTIIFFIVLSCFTITEITIYSESFAIKKYYLLGYFSSNLKYEHSDSFDIQQTEIPLFIEEATFLIEPNTIFSLLFFGNNASYKRYLIAIKKKNNIIKKMHVTLSFEEYEYLFNIFCKIKK